MAKDEKDNTDDTIPVHRVGPLEMVPTNALTSELLRRGHTALFMHLRAHSEDDGTPGGVLFWFKGDPANLAQMCSRVHSQLWLIARGHPPIGDESCDVPT